MVRSLVGSIARVRINWISSWSERQTVESPRAKTDAKGQFRITGVPKGYGRVVCFAKGYHAPLQQTRPVPSENLVITVGQTGTIEGRVVGERPKGRTLNVSVAPEGGNRVGKWGGSMRVRPDGSFRFANVPPGTYLISTRPLLPGAWKPSSRSLNRKLSL